MPSKTIANNNIIVKVNNNAYEKTLNNICFQIALFIASDYFLQIYRFNNLTILHPCSRVDIYFLDDPL